MYIGITGEQGEFERAPLGVDAWQKSSHSGGTGGDCAEVAAQRAGSPSETPRTRTARLHRHPAAFARAL
ncbi:DUF397 domain-containing protein [Streptomyces sp. NPDC003042]